MVESMVEGVARAIVERLRGAGAVVWEEDVAAARAAIGAMREPTDAMVDAGVDHIGEGHYNGWAYTAMIDAALNEQVSG